MKDLMDTMVRAAYHSFEKDKLLHFFIASVITAILSRYMSSRYTVLVVFLVAVLKETIDSAIRGGEFGLADILWTVAPALIAMYQNTSK
jgi:hypothetical protein